MWLLIFACSIVLSVSTIAAAEDDDGWNHIVAPLYLWAVGIEGESQIGPITAPVDIEFKDALSNLGGAFTIHFEAQRKREKWGLLVDFMYVDIEPSGSTPTGVPVDVSIENIIMEFGGTYRLVEEPRYRLEALGGVRISKFKQTVDVRNGPSLVDVNETWADVFGGVRITGKLSENWKLIGRADAGGGGSDLVWNAVMLADWRFKHWGTAFAGYRWLDYDYKTGKGPSRFTYDVTYQGPMLGAAINW